MLIRAADTIAAAHVNVLNQLDPLAAFEVIIYGRFWVITEATAAAIKKSGQAPDAPAR